MREKPRELPRSWEDLERMAGIKSNQPKARTQADIVRLTQKALPSWGRRRKKFYGP